MIWRIGKIVSLFLTGGIIIHALIMFIDYYLISEPLHVNLRNNFIGSIFSAPMIPMILAYGVSFVLINFLWVKSQKALQLVLQKEAQKEAVKFYLKSMQRLTGILAGRISNQNAEIMSWIQSQRLRGRQVSKKVDIPNQKIAQALHVLSEISFIYPYADFEFTDIKDIEEVIQKKFNEITESPTLMNPDLSKMNPNECFTTQLNHFS